MEKVGQGELVVVAGGGGAGIQVGVPALAARASGPWRRCRVQQGRSAVLQAAFPGMARDLLRGSIVLPQRHLSQGSDVLTVLLVFHHDAQAGQFVAEHARVVLVVVFQ